MSTDDSLKLKQTLALYENIFDTLPGHVYWKDRQGKFLGCNRLQAEAFGLPSRDQVVGKTAYDFVSREEAEALDLNDQQVMESGVEQTIEEPAILSDGSIITYLSKKTPLRNDKGNIIGILGISFDMTIEQREKEKQWMLLNCIIAELPGHVYWKDLNGVFLGCNNSQAKSAGFNKAGEIVGKTDYDMPWKDQAEQLRTIDEYVIKTGKTVTVEEMSDISDKEKAIFLSKKLPLKDGKGKVTGILGISFDVTAEREAEQKVIEANKSKSRFISAVDRLVRNPLSAILGTSQLLQQKKLAAEQQEIVDIIVSSSERITPLLDRVQYYLDLEDGILKPVQDTFQLVEFLQRMLLPFEQQAGKKGLRFEFKHNEQLPDWVEGCSHFISHVLGIVMSNAVKYTATGSITVVANKLDQQGDQLLLSIAVSDTGQGIHPDVQQVLFHLFDRAEESFVDAGLNLSIAAKMLSLIGGRIEVTSEFDKGSTFEIRVPLMVASPPPYRQQHSMAHGYQAPEPAVLARPLTDRIRVLSVEDDTIVQHAFKVMMNDLYNCDLDQVYNLKDAYQKISDYRYDIVFLDMNLPDGTGMEFLSFLNEQQLDPRPPVIVVTSFSKEDDTTDIIEAGAQDVIVKPLSFEVLKDVVLAYVFESQDD